MVVPIVVMMMTKKKPTTMMIVARQCSTNGVVIEPILAALCFSADFQQKKHYRCYHVLPATRNDVLLRTPMPRSMAKNAVSKGEGTVSFAVLVYTARS